MARILIPLYFQPTSTTLQKLRRAGWSNILRFTTIKGACHGKELHLPDPGGEILHQGALGGRVFAPVEVIEYGLVSLVSGATLKQCRFVDLTRACEE